jgi:iron transport multicopper oxidase
MKNIVRTNDMTPEYCISAAEARLTAVPATTYHYVGVEYGRECYGATAAPSAPTSLVGRKACTMTCKGNERHSAVEICGGRMQYNLYASVTRSVFSGPVPTMAPSR